MDPVCPAARLSSPAAIQVGNWVLIERIVGEGKQHKQMETQNKASGGCSKFSGYYICQPTTVSVHHEAVSLAKADMTSLGRAAISHFSFLLSALLSSLYCSLYFLCLFSSFVFLCLKYPCFNSSSLGFPRVTWFGLSCSFTCSYSSVCFFSSSSSHISVCRSPWLQLKQHNSTRGERERKGHNE